MLRLKANVRNRAAKDHCFRLQLLHGHWFELTFEKTQPGFHRIEAGNAGSAKVLERVHRPVEGGRCEQQQGCRYKQNLTIAFEDCLIQADILKTESR